MDKDEFAKGVEIAQKAMARFRFDILQTLSDDVPPEIRYDPEEVRPSVLIEQGKTNVVSWEILKELTLECLRKGYQAPDEHIEWLGNVLDGKLQRPTRKQPDLKINFRNTEAVHAIQTLVGMGWQASRSKSLSPECCAEGGSAADAVGYALNLGFSTINNIWTKRAGFLSPSKPEK